jgi:integrase
MRATIGERAENSGPFVFSTTNGMKPFHGYAKLKVTPDRKLAQIRKRDGKEPIERWTYHDLRRTARSLMSRAKVPADIGERVLGHTMPGVRATYDRSRYASEKLDALIRLDALVTRILNPTLTGNITSLSEARTSRS